MRNLTPAGFAAGVLCFAGLLLLVVPVEEASEEFFFGLFAGGGGFFYGFVGAKVAGLALEGDLGGPFPLVFAPVYAADAAGVGVEDGHGADEFNICALDKVNVVFDIVFTAAAGAVSALEVGLLNIDFFSAVADAVPEVDAVSFSGVGKDGEAAEALAFVLFQGWFAEAAAAFAVAAQELFAGHVDSAAAVALAFPDHAAVLAAVCRLKNCQLAKTHTS